MSASKLPMVGDIVLFHMREDDPWIPAVVTRLCETEGQVDLRVFPNDGADFLSFEVPWHDREPNEERSWRHTERSHG